MRTGAQAEQTAAQFLQRQGLRLLQTNYHCRFGEIDLILQDGATRVFVEVRLRSHSGFGGAAASIDARKQHKLILTAQHYLSRHSPVPPCRFDAVLLTDAADTNGVEWIKGAFELG
ncbi:YraN family protein [Ferrigenium sp. UT5]|uniref:YraN family protein n=1 Tax=Ferrigenium sp. UT5 TaxID=3242105 RepID=UPI0038B3AE3E